MIVWHLTGAALAVALVALLIVLAVEAARRQRRRKTMHPHLECGRVGKFDCDYDAEVYRLIGEEGTPGDGQSDAPVGWFAEMDLDDVSEARAVEHYGTRHLIVREFSDGRVVVELYDTREARDERLAVLEDEYERWWE